MSSESPLSRDELLQLVHRLQTDQQEWNTCDAKSDLHLDTRGDKAEFAKDVIAMANNRAQSFLLIGLQDGTFDANPDFDPSGITLQRLTEMLDCKIDPPVPITLQMFSVDSRPVLAVGINGTNPPYLVQTDEGGRKSRGGASHIHTGTLYVRHGDTTRGASRSELDHFYDLDPVRAAFAADGPDILTIALQKPPFWEYALTAAVLSCSALPTQTNLRRHSPRRRFQEDTCAPRHRGDPLRQAETVGS